MYKMAHSVSSTNGSMTKTSDSTFLHSSFVLFEPLANIYGFRVNKETQYVYFVVRHLFRRNKFDLFLIKQIRVCCFTICVILYKKAQS